VGASAIALYWGSNIERVIAREVASFLKGVKEVGVLEASKCFLNIVDFSLFQSPLGYNQSLKKLNVNVSKVVRDLGKSKFVENKLVVDSCRLMNLDVIPKQQKALVHVLSAN
jgi:hypothetical protein